MKGKIKYLMIIVAIIVSMAIMIPSANWNLSLFANNNSMSADISGEKTPDIHNVDSQSLFSTTDSGLSSSGVVAQNLMSGDSHNHASLLAGDTRAATSGEHVDCAGGHSGWTAITTTGGNLTAGTNYVLNDDVNLTTNLTIIANATVNLCLNGFKLTGNGSGSVITIGENATLNLYDCQAASAATEHQHAYYVGSAGKYIYDDGTTTWDNNSTEAGSNKQGTTSGGVITGDSVARGGGINNSGTLNLFGGTIAGNIATSSGNGGGVYVNSGTFKMSNDAKISGNTASGGGGVYVHGLAVDGSAKNSNFTMSNTSKISGNTATGSGGGVNLFGFGASFSMNGGEITNNKSGSEGGGVYVYEKSFSMNGGTISSNKAPSGGGVYIHSHNNPQFNISGAPKITDNTLIDGTTNNNVHLSTGKIISVTGPLDADASIGISPNTASVFTSGYGEKNTTTGTVTPPTFFTLDDNSNGTIGIKLNTTGEAEIAAKYTLTFDANGGTDAAAGAPTSSILFNGDALANLDKTKLPTRTDYIFMGYFDTTNNGVQYFNADGTVSTAGETPKTFDKTENTIFYAQWKIDIAPVTAFVVKADGNDPIYKGEAFTAADLSVTNTILGDGVAVGGSILDNTNFTFEMVADGTVLGNETTVDNKNASISGQTAINKTARIKITGTGDYTGTTYFNFTIAKATLTVTPNAGQTKAYGETDQVLTYAHSGAEGNETPNFEGALSRATGNDCWNI